MLATDVRAFLLHAALRISAPFGGLGGGLINLVCGSPYSGGVAPYSLYFD